MTHPSGLDLRTKSIEESIAYIEESGQTIGIDYQPGNGTRYTLIITKLTSLGPEFLKCIGRKGKTWQLVWLDGSMGKAMTFGKGTLHYNYFKEKLRCSLSDAIVIAEIVGHLTENDHVSCDDYVIRKSF